MLESNSLQTAQKDSKSNPQSNLVPRSSQRRQNRLGPYLLLRTLGEGEFGKVKLGMHIETGQEVAVKLIKKNTVDSTCRANKIEREVAILKSLDHPFIVKLMHVVETDKYIGIILEYASGGELFEYIFAHRYLKEKDAQRLFAQLISSVQYMHQKKIVHRDLKLENLLLDRNRNVIVTDFGFANQFEDDDDLMATSCGSPCYAAPELVVTDGLYTGSAVDIWSCGVILYAMLCGYLPFDDDPANPKGNNINLLYRYILSTQLSFPVHVGPDAQDLLQKMLVPDPVKRSSLQSIITHPWLAAHRHLFLPDPSSPTDIQVPNEPSTRPMLTIRPQPRILLPDPGLIDTSSQDRPGKGSCAEQSHTNVTNIPAEKTRPKHKNRASDLFSFVKSKQDPTDKRLSAIEYHPPETVSSAFSRQNSRWMTSICSRTLPQSSNQLDDQRSLQPPDQSLSQDPTHLNSPLGTLRTVPERLILTEPEARYGMEWQRSPTAKRHSWIPSIDPSSAQTAWLDNKAKKGPGQKVMAWIKRKSRGKDRRQTMDGQVCTAQSPTTGSYSVQGLCSYSSPDTAVEPHVANLRIHEGAIDRDGLSSRSPAEIMASLEKTLKALGIEVRYDSQYCLKCTRRKVRIPVLADSQPQTDMEPVYGDPAFDGGEEIRFIVEVCRFRNLPHLYIVDIRRLRGNVWVYRFLYRKLFSLIDLGGQGYL